jgi:exonuclease III
VNGLLRHFDGNVLAFEVLPDGEVGINVVAVYSPAWPVARDFYLGQDIREVKLNQNPEIWVTDLIMSALRSSLVGSAKEWVIAGDFNSCETFDEWKGGPRGNKEWLDRMASIGLVDCLRASSAALVPTFKGPRMAVAGCQIDKMFVTPGLLKRMASCTVGDESRVFGQGLSDHLPVVADFIQ